MKIVRFRHGNAHHYGVLEKTDIIRFLQAPPFPVIHVSDETCPLAEATLLAPVERPPNIFAIGLNYRRHAEESGAELPERPLVFIKAATALTGPDSPIILPELAPNEVDYEAELAMIIGKEAKNVEPENALTHVLGFACANDVSARDCQLRLDGQWARAKSFDTFCPLGPWIETEIDPSDLAVELRLNGQVMQRSSTSDLIFDCSQLVSYLSRCFTLLPGTVILTGTPGGVGFARKPPVFLKPGDTVETDIEGIGVLRNTVVREA